MKATVEQLRSEYAFSERRACRLIGLAVSTYRYEPCRNDARLREQLTALAREKPRYGYRRLHVLLLRSGTKANHKRVWRVYHEAGLSVKRRKRKRLARVGQPSERVSAPSQEWALDFASDRLATGRSLRVLSVVDTFTRECIALEADTSFASRRVTRVLEAALTACRATTHSVRQRARAHVAAFSSVVP
jgi:putative transposase